MSPITSRAGSVWLVVLLGATTLGEGGAHPRALLATHALVAVAVLARLLAPGPWGGFRVSRGPALTLGALAAWSLAGAALAPYVFAAWLTTVELAIFLAVVWLVAGRGEGDLEGAVPPLVGLAALHAASSWGGRLVGAVDRPATTFLNPNHLALWLVAVSLLAAPRLVRAGTRGRAALGAGAGFAILGAVPTGSRGAMLALLVGGGVLAVLSWRTISSRARRAFLIAGATVVLLAAAGVAWRFRSPDPFTFHRVRIWGASLGAALDRPWLGTGPGQFSHEAPALNFPLEGEALRFARYFSTPHSDVVRSAAELGWPGAALALLTAVTVVATVLRRGPPATWSSTRRGAAAALAALGAQALVDDVTSRPALYVLAAALLGALLSEPEADARPDVPRGARAAAALGIAVVFVVGDLAPYRAWALSRDLPRGLLDPSARSRLARALRYNPLHPDLWLRRAEDLTGDGFAGAPERYAEAREAAERAQRLQPRDAAYARGVARVEAIGVRTLFPTSDGRDRAGARYREAERLAPHDPVLPLELGEFLLSVSDPEGARRAAERALRIEPNAAAPRVLLAEALLGTDSSSNRTSATRLLNEAETLAADSGVRGRTSPYERRLMSADPARIARLRSSVSRGDSP